MGLAGEVGVVGVLGPVDVPCDDPFEYERLNMADRRRFAFLDPSKHSYTSDKYRAMELRSGSAMSMSSGSSNAGMPSFCSPIENACKGWKKIMLKSKGSFMNTVTRTN